MLTEVINSIHQLAAAFNKYKVTKMAVSSTMKMMTQMKLKKISAI